MDHQRFMTQVALAAGKLALNKLGSGLTSELKSDKTVVTSMDRAVHELVVREVRKHFPTYGIFGEEGSSKGSAPYFFSVDEIDGTVPAMLGMGHFVFSIALMARKPNGSYTVETALVYNPTTEVMYTATVGKGAYARRRHHAPVPLRVNNKSLAPGTILDVEWWPQAPRQFSYFLEAARQISQRTGAYCLMPGSAISGAMLVASGGCAATVFAGGTDDKLPDVTASSLIVQEAGGVVLDLAGQPLDFAKFRNGALFANKIVAQEVLRYFTSRR